MALTRRGRQPKTADIPITFKPFGQDFVAINSLAKAGSTQRPEIVRMLVSEALRERRLKAINKDEAMDAVVLAQKKAMAEVLAPFTEKLNTITSDLRRVEGRMATEFTQAEQRQSFLVTAVKCLVFEVFLCRQLLRDYVHTLHVRFVQSLDKPVKDIEANFNRRLQKYKAEVGELLDGLTDESVGDLHTMADTAPGFLEAPGSTSIRPQA